MKNSFNPKQYSLYLQSHIKPWARPASGGRVINCRCFYCPDSTNRSHGHFYIKVPQKNDEPSLFYCQKCGARGMVTSTKLMEWQIYDSDIAISLTLYNKGILSLPQNRKFMSVQKYMISNTQLKIDDATNEKLRYLNNRLGLNLLFRDYVNMKIVFNLGDIINENKLKITRDSRIVEQLDFNFIGFLSFDNSFLSMRNANLLDKSKLHSSIDKRYVNYHLIDTYDNTNRYYIIPTTINLLDPDPIELHIAEGVMDILSICLNLRHQQSRSVYCAAMGKGYKGLLRFLLTYLKTPNLIIHIYPDNDMDRDSILDIHEYLEQYRFPFYIHRNVYFGEKDFGVSKDKINESIERIL